MSVHHEKEKIAAVDTFILAPALILGVNWEWRKEPGTAELHCGRSLLLPFIHEWEEDVKGNTSITAVSCLVLWRCPKTVDF